MKRIAAFLLLFLISFSAALRAQDQVQQGP
jgi:hypothetical protein